MPYDVASSRDLLPGPRPEVGSVARRRRREDLDVGSMFRTAKHWLVLQGRDSYMIVQLEDDNWRPILNTVVDRTKVQITLAKEEEK